MRWFLHSLMLLIVGGLTFLRIFFNPLHLIDPIINFCLITSFYWIGWNFGKFHLKRTR
jgi:hypothetical protein